MRELLSNWIQSKLPQQSEPKENVFIFQDCLAWKYHKVLKLREICRRDIAESVKNGRPYSMIKLVQAERLLTLITEQINNRPTIFNQFNMY